MDSKTYIETLRTLLDKVPHDQVTNACNALSSLRLRGGTLYIFGNGGSAALASHLSCDLNKGVTGFPLLKVNCLNDHLSELTAIANDMDYSEVFSVQLQKLLQKQDMIFAISTSGNSKNVVKAAEMASRRGAESIGLTGFDGGELKRWISHPIIIPDTSVQRIEDIHVIVSHIIFLKMMDPILTGEGLL
jgi:D-sedoheptulose 7-phosphate isomerase